MNKEFIPYNQAFFLKHLGFDEPCFGFYSKEEQLIIARGDCLQSTIENVPTAPLYQQVFKWFREKYNYVSYIKGRKGMGFDYTLTDVPSNKSIRDTLFSVYVYDTYEEAELECLKKLIEIVKSKKI